MAKVVRTTPMPQLKIREEESGRERMTERNESR
jgi:hypothetical protein